MLTLSQRKTFDFIQRYIMQHDYAPTVAEIAKGIGIKSRGVVHRYLRALETAGVISLTPKRHRNIRLSSAHNPGSQTIPLVGVIAAGQPIEAIQQNETIDVVNIFLGANRYALRVKGTSMIDEGIFDGDIVICEKNNAADDGQIVVALVDQQEATLKRLQRNADNTVTLRPANSNLQPMTYPAHRVAIQGIYIGLLRLT